MSDRNRRAWARAQLLTAAAGVLLALSGIHDLPAQKAANHECGIANFPAPELCVRARLDTVHATYTLLVDESGSMRPLWPAVQRALSEFAAAIPDGDELDVRLFADSPRGLIAPLPASDRARADWARRFAELPAPAGAHTDLGSAARSALAAVRSAPADRLQFIFFLTDGQQSAASSSPFPNSWGGAWPALASEASTLTSARPVSVVILRLTDDADRSLLTRVFPNAVVTDAIGPDALRSWFTKASRDIAVAKLRLLISRDLSHPAFTVSGDLATGLRGAGTGGGTLTSERRVVTTMFIDSAAAALGNGGQVTVRIPQSAAVAPDHAEIFARSPSRAWFLPPSRSARQITATAVGTARLEPASELSRIGINPASRPDSISIASTARTSIASILLYYLVAVLLAVLAIVLLVRLKWAAHRAHLPGALVIENANNTTDKTRVELAREKRQSYTVVTPSGTPAVCFTARSSRGKTIVEVVPLDGAVTLRGKPLRVPAPVSGNGRIEYPADRPDVIVHFFLP